MTSSRRRSRTGGQDSRVRAIRRAFRFLEREHGFALGDSHASQREANVKFVRDSVRVSITLEHGGPPFVQVGRVASESGMLVENYELLLFALAHESAAELAASVRSSEGTATEMLARQARVLGSAAAAALRGDFSRGGELKRVRAELRRKANQAQFGTATGESPRFVTRPTLAELFAGVTDDAMRQPRAYQARWDFDYSLHDIAAFLEIDEPAVQRLLDGWDGLL